MTRVGAACCAAVATDGQRPEDPDKRELRSDHTRGQAPAELHGRSVSVARVRDDVDRPPLASLGITARLPRRCA